MDGRRRREAHPHAGANREDEKRGKSSTLQDARNTVSRYFLPHFGEDTPLYAVERFEVAVVRSGRQVLEVREDRRDTFTTDDVDAFRELLASHLSARSAQKMLVLLHALFKLAKRRKLIQSNPSEDAERVTVEDPGTFNILEPVEFEAVAPAIEDPMFAAMLSTAFYAGLRLGELLDLPWRCVDFDRSLIRVESGFTHGSRSTPKGKPARSTPMVPVLAQRLAELSTRGDFTGESDYVFVNDVGDRVRDANVRAAFYAALDAAGLSDRRAERTSTGTPRRRCGCMTCVIPGAPGRPTCGRSPRCSSTLDTATSRRRCVTCTIRPGPRTRISAARTSTGYSRRRQSSNSATRPTARGARSRR